MDANTWLWVALIAFLAFCCLPMFLMGRRNKRSGHSGTSHGPDKGPLR